MTDPIINREFAQCPNCGSKRQFFATLTKQLKDKGLARPEWNFHYDTRQGVIVDKVKEPSLPLGSEVPSYNVRTDICLDCGTVYAVKLESGTAKKSMSPPKIWKPGEMPLGANNPMAS